MPNKRKWRRFVAEYRTLEGYNEFYRRATKQRINGTQARGSGENDNNKAYKEYVKHMFLDGHLETLLAALAALKNDLQFAPRWAIWVEGYVEKKDGLLLDCRLRPRSFIETLRHIYTDLIIGRVAIRVADPFQVIHLWGEYTCYDFGDLEIPTGRPHRCHHVTESSHLEPARHPPTAPHGSTPSNTPKDTQSSRAPSPPRKSGGPSAYLPSGSHRCRLGATGNYGMDRADSTCRDTQNGPGRTAPVAPIPIERSGGPVARSKGPSLRQPRCRAIEGSDVRNSAATPCLHHTARAIARAWGTASQTRDVLCIRLSVGDIIAVGQIAWALAQALTDSRGSTKEYQGLVKELQTFDQALLQVIALWQNYEESPELMVLGTTTRNVVKDWRDILLVFRLKVDKKYGTSLSPGGCGNWLKDASKKVVWLKEKEDILELRRKLQMASDTITMLCLAAMGKSNRLDSSAQKVRAKTSDMILSRVKSSMAYLFKVHTIVIDMKSVLSLLHSHLLSQQATPRGLGTHWQQAPVTLEDALGFMVPIPLELVNSWEMFDLIISKRFEKHPGHKMVRNGMYAIEEGSSGQELSRTSELVLCLRPGQKIDMSMVFSEGNANNNTCPRCGTEAMGSTESRIQCQNSSCKMWFQRIVEMDEQVTVSESAEQAKPNGMPSPTREETISNDEFRSTPTARALHPRDFQRVRLLRKYHADRCTMCNKRIISFSMRSCTCNKGATRALQLGSIPSSTTVSTLVEMFKLHGPIISARVLTHKNCGFVNFERLESAISARATMNGKEIFPGTGPIRINFALPPSSSSSDAESDSGTSSESDRALFVNSVRIGSDTDSEDLIDASPTGANEAPSSIPTADLTDARASKGPRPKKHQMFALGGSSSEDSMSDNSVESNLQRSQKKKAMFSFGGSSNEDESSLPERVKNRSALTDSVEQPLSYKKQTMFKDEVATRAIKEEQLLDDDVFETDEDEIDESAIGDDDDSSDWEDSIEDSGNPSTDEKIFFPRIDPRLNLTQRRSLIATMLHQNDGANTLANATAASGSTSAL
ncbi:hypothetical protein G7Y89_g15282 [Cudoniella acicularis]|uniref:RRM domain-containing protein n=1 Tax=Cudoniella acicularis TaxID=354080 RepID=A0A8H4QRX5_9HELO|nr:hypothetical protein G7Y89_g15282 [Cudoniella acicularis]